MDIPEDNDPVDRSEGQPPASRITSRPLSLKAKIGIAIVSFHVSVALLGPSLAPKSEAEVVTRQIFAMPGTVGLFGSDFLGRDVFSRVLNGAKRTIGLALVAVLLAFAVGVGLGFAAATGGGLLDTLISRTNDVFLSFPVIMLALIVISAFGTSIPVLVVTVGLVESTRVLRLSRAVAMDIVVKDFVEAARARGEGLWWIMRREILPNAIAPLTAELGLRYTFSILFISSLSFVGLGVQPPAADWGAMIRENMPGLLLGSPAALIPAVAIGSLTVGVNLLVDSLLEQSNRDISQELLH